MYLSIRSGVNVSTGLIAFAFRLCISQLYLSSICQCSYVNHTVCQSDGPVFVHNLPSNFSDDILPQLGMTSVVLLNIR